MHIFGKILIAFVVLAGLGGAVIASRLLEVRNSWMEKVDKVVDETDKQQIQLVEKRKKLKNLKIALDETQLGWGSTWSAGKQAKGDQTDGSLASTVGMNDGFGGPDAASRPELPTAFVFSRKADGSSAYLGIFQVPERNALRADGAMLNPINPLRPGETDSWTTDWTKPFDIRVRTMIPNSYRSAFTSHRRELITKDQRLDDAVADSAGQDVVAAEAASILKLGEAELVGDSTADPVVEGLVGTSEREEDTRNARQQAVDKLRRDLRAAFKVQTQLRSEIEQLADSLSPKKPASKKPTP
jgi:hypothetical protein